MPIWDSLPTHIYSSLCIALKTDEVYGSASHPTQEPRAVCVQNTDGSKVLVDYLAVVRIFTAQIRQPYVKLED